MHHNCVAHSSINFQGSSDQQAPFACMIFFVCKFYAKAWFYHLLEVTYAEIRTKYKRQSCTKAHLNVTIPMPMSHATCVFCAVCEACRRSLCRWLSECVAVYSRIRGGGLHLASVRHRWQWRHASSHTCAAWNMVPRCLLSDNSLAAPHSTDYTSTALTAPHNTYYASTTLTAERQLSHWSSQHIYTPQLSLPNDNSLTDPHSAYHTCWLCKDIFVVWGYGGANK